MKISDMAPDSTVIQYIQQNGKVGPAERNPGTSPAQTPAPAAEDKVDLSAQSKEMNKIHEVLNATPDLRSEKIEALKKQIESGRYEVDSHSVADKMIKEFLFEMNR